MLATPFLVIQNATTATWSVGSLVAFLSGALSSTLRGPITSYNTSTAQKRKQTSTISTTLAVPKDMISHNIQQDVYVRNIRGYQPICTRTVYLQKLDIRTAEKNNRNGATFILHE
uniref:Secreted protein n=1 Tax=Steinernema glaseri TaxID=37863 RepID=A0A1I8A2C8_9BILA